MYPHAEHWQLQMPRSKCGETALTQLAEALVIAYLLKGDCNVAVVP